MHGGYSEVVAGVNVDASNPDAIKLIGVLMKAHLELLKIKVSPSGVPALLLKAWIGYAHLFNKHYAGLGDQSCIPEIRLVVRRLTGSQPRLTVVEILQRMGGFAFRMDTLRSKGDWRYYPKPAWVDIYGRGDKNVTAWQEARRSDPAIEDTLKYLLSLEPFVKPTDAEGRPLRHAPAPCGGQACRTRRGRPPGTGSRDRARRRGGGGRRLPPHARRAWKVGDTC